MIVNLREEITNIFGPIMAEIHTSNRTIVITNSKGNLQHWSFRVGYSAEHNKNPYHLYYLLKGSIFMETEYTVEVIDQYFEPLRVPVVKEEDEVIDIRSIVGRLAIEDIPFYRIIKEEITGSIILQVPDTFVSEMILRAGDIEDELGIEVEVISLKDSYNGEILFVK